MSMNTKVCNPFKENFGDERVAICVTTNGIVMNNGKAVMGAGVAKFVRDNFDGVDEKLGKYLKQYGNRAFNLGPQEFEDNKFLLLSYPTKNHFKDKSDMNLIKESAQQISDIAEKLGVNKIFVPAPGCTNGQLEWSKVCKAIAPVFENSDKEFVITSLDKKTFSKHANYGNSFSP